MYIEATVISMSIGSRKTEKRIIKVVEMKLKWHRCIVLAVCKYPLAFRLRSVDVGDVLALFVTAKTKKYRSELSGEWEFYTENYVEDFSIIKCDAFERL